MNGYIATGCSLRSDTNTNFRYYVSMCCDCAASPASPCIRVFIIMYSIVYLGLHPSVCSLAHTHSLSRSIIRIPCVAVCASCIVHVYAPLSFYISEARAFTLKNTQFCFFYFSCRRARLSIFGPRRVVCWRKKSRLQFSWFLEVRRVTPNQTERAQ